MLKDSRRPARPLPEALRRRLKAIPRRVVACREVDRLYVAALAPSRDRRVEPAAAEHLASCGRCRRLYGTLESAFAEAPRRPSPTLVGRLKGIARQPLVPAWIADGRYAAAACFLLTVILTSFAGDSAALFRDGKSRVESRAAVWSGAVESGGRWLWDGLSATLSTALTAGYETGREKIQDYGESIEEYGASGKAFLEERVRDLGSFVQSLRKPAPEGDSDGESEPESESPSA